MLYFVTGGARSGKSHFAEDLAKSKLKSDSGRMAYIATGIAMDEEFRQRIAQHRQQRGRDFQTYEAPLAIDSCLELATAQHRIIIVECLTTWLGNLFHTMADRGFAEIEQAADQTVANFLSVAAANQSSSIIVVGNELGMGLVPPDPASRAYRDVHGRINRRIALAADAAWLLVSGLPIKLK